MCPINFEGTHRVIVENYGEDINTIYLDVDAKELHLLRKIEMMFNNNHHGYCSTLKVVDLTQLEIDSELRKKEYEEELKRKHEQGVYDNGVVAHAFKKAGII